MIPPFLDKPIYKTMLQPSSLGVPMLPRSDGEPSLGFLRSVCWFRDGPGHGTSDFGRFWTRMDKNLDILTGHGSWLPSLYHYSRHSLSTTGSHISCGTPPTIHDSLTKETTIVSRFVVHHLWTYRHTYTCAYITGFFQKTTKCIFCHCPPPSPQFKVVCLRAWSRPSNKQQHFGSAQIQALDLGVMGGYVGYCWPLMRWLFVLKSLAIRPHLY